RLANESKRVHLLTFLGALALSAVLGSRLLPIGNALRIEHPANDVIAHARQIPNAAATNQDNRVLLKIVTLAGNVGRHFYPTREADPRDLAQGGIRLLGGHGLDLKTHAPLLGAALHRGVLRPSRLLSPCFADELISGRHASLRCHNTRAFNPSP